MDLISICNEMILIYVNQFNLLNIRREIWSQSFIFCNLGNWFTHSSKVLMNYLRRKEN